MFRRGDTGAQFKILGPNQTVKLELNISRDEAYLM